MGKTFCRWAQLTDDNNVIPVPAPRPSLRKKNLGNNSMMFAVTWVDELKDVLSGRLHYSPEKVKAVADETMEKFFERNIVIVLRHLDNDIRFAEIPHIVPDDENPGGYIWGIERRARSHDEILAYKQERREKPCIFTHAILAVTNYDGEVPFLRRDDGAIAMHLRELNEASDAPDDPEAFYILTRQMPTSGNYLH